jgi:ribosomal protein S18 acetylase RimI-like enzyme
VAVDGSDVVGALTAECVTYETFLKMVPTDMVESVREETPRFDFHRIGVIRTVAVADSRRGRGVGTRLAKAAIDRLRKLGATAIVTVGWADSNGCHIAGLVKALGFEELATLENYWKKDSTSKQYDCPTCGNPCKCQAKLFLLTYMHSG